MTYAGPPHDETTALVLRLPEPERAAALHYLKVVRLAGDPETLLALDDGESVFLSHLDPFWVARYRKAAA